MNMNTRLLRLNVKQATTNMIAAHLKSPRNKAGKKPKKNTVHEKPIGASFMAPVLGFLNTTDVNAMPVSLMPQWVGWMAGLSMQRFKRQAHANASVTRVR